MKLLIRTVHKTRKDGIRNAHIKGEIKMEKIQNQTEKSTLRWFGHVKEQIPKR
jgi:hypothetical protein